jgi:hypothetical protein
MVCDDCKFVAIGEEEAKLISKQLRNALALQLEFEGKLPDLISEIIKTASCDVTRKAEVNEVAAVIRGASQ